MTLYEIGQQYLQALEGLQVDPDTGELVGGEQIALLAGQFEEKCEAVGCYIKQLEGQAALLKAEKENLSKRQKTLETKADRLRQYLSDWMIAAGRDKLETPRLELRWRKSTATIVDDQDLLPAHLLKIQITPNKADIHSLLKKGQAVPGAHLEETRNLQIK